MEQDSGILERQRTNEVQQSGSGSHCTTVVNVVKNLGLEDRGIVKVVSHLPPATLCSFDESSFTELGIRDKRGDSYFERVSA